jgi:hypothetical protein
LRELNIERMRYFVVNVHDRILYLLKSSNRAVDAYLKFRKIERIERDLRDHRMIWIKIQNIPNCIYLTFSSVYKLSQFLEVYNYLTSPDYLLSQQPHLIQSVPALKKTTSTASDSQRTNGGALP